MLSIYYFQIYLFTSIKQGKLFSDKKFPSELYVWYVGNGALNFNADIGLHREKTVRLHSNIKLDNNLWIKKINFHLFHDLKMSFRILQNFERISKSCDNIEGERLKHYYLQRWFLKSNKSFWKIYKAG